MTGLVNSTVAFSNSDVQEFLTCERKFYYSHDCNLQPKVKSKALNRGIIGHSLLETWYRSFNPKEVEKTYLDICTQDPNNFEDASDILQLVFNYISHYYGGTDTLPTIISVEQEYQVAITDTMTFKFKPDLVYKDHNDKIVLMDHKFVWNFYDQDKLALMPQLLKYSTALQSVGIPVDIIAVNQLRTRKVPTNPYQRDYLKFTSREIQNTWFQHEVVVNKLNDWVTKSLMSRNSIALRCYSPMVCNSCQFQQICIGDLKGQDTTPLINTEFEANEYVSGNYPRIGN